jgi:hypothetical protein
MTEIRRARKAEIKEMKRKLFPIRIVLLRGNYITLLAFSFARREAGRQSIGFAEQGQASFLPRCQGLAVPAGWPPLTRPVYPPGARGCGSHFSAGRSEISS